MMRDRDATPGLTDAAIKAMLDRRARRADAADLRHQILTATRSERQRKRWRAGLPVLIHPSLARACLLAAVVAAIVGLGLIGSGAFQTDRTPMATAADFLRPFTYAPPADDAFKSVGEQSREMIAWVLFPDQPGRLDPDVAATERQPGASGAKGIIVASAEQAWAHGNGGRFNVQTAPAGFIADLRDIGGVPMRAVADTTLAGYPALTVMLLATGVVGADITDVHVTANTSLSGLTTDNVVLNLPARLIVADIDGDTVFVLIWARTTADLDAWMPIANEFVESIRFVPEGQQ